MYSKLCNELSNLDLVDLIWFLIFCSITKNTNICSYNHERGNNVIFVKIY
jgi:hypothetical protein